MWLLASLGVFLHIHYVDWYFFPDLPGHDAATIWEIGGVYLAWTGAQVPVAAFAGMVISSSDFTRPLPATFWTMAAYHLLFSAIRAVHWPWKSAHDLDQRVPVAA